MGTHVVWVAAPWVLELVDAAAAARLVKLVEKVPAAVQQRLAVVAAAGEPVTTGPFLQVLGSCVPPLGEEMPVHDVVRDLPRAEAW